LTRISRLGEVEDDEKLKEKNIPGLGSARGLSSVQLLKPQHSKAGSMWQ
jgi:hypothetical protein